jgi:hypothetical protein
LATLRPLVALFCRLFNFFLLFFFLSLFIQPRSGSAHREPSLYHFIA